MGNNQSNTFGNGRLPPRLPKIYRSAGPLSTATILRLLRKHTPFLSSSVRNWNQPKYEPSLQTLLSSGDLYVSTLFGKAASMNQ